MAHSPVSSADSGILDIDTAPSSTATAEVFSRPTVATISNIRIDKEPLISPALSGFTFNLDLEPASPSTQLSAYSYPEITTLPEVTSISFADSFNFNTPKTPHAVSQPPTRGARNPDTMNEDGAVARSDSASRRAQYYDSSFSSGGSTKESVRERIQRDSPIIAELRTNVIIKNEYTIVTSLSQHLSERYRRPESAILLTVKHSTCLMMGGSFEPAYILDISAIPSEVQAVTNKRNAYLIQCFMAEVLYVASNRGVVRFLGIDEEQLATNGSTVAGEIERAEKEASIAAPKVEKSNGLVRSLTSKSSRKSIIGEKRKSVAAENRKSVVRSAGKDANGDNSNSVFHTLERKFSTRSLRSVKSFKGKISPPIPTEMPPELLPSPTSISGFSMASSIQHQLPNLPQIHRLSPLHGISGSPSKDQSSSHLNKDLPPLSPLSQNPPSLPQPPLTPTFDRASNTKEIFVTSSSRRPSLSASIRPQSARKNLSNITGPAEAIPSPPPIPKDLPQPMLGPRLSKRKSFVALFKKGDGAIKV